MVVVVVRYWQGSVFRGLVLGALVCRDYCFVVQYQ